MKKITLNDTLYPEKLKTIPNPPINIYVEGNTDLLDSKSIAIIGSRIASENGKLLAKKFATELSQSGITIVSGLAAGIDSIAHSFSYNQKGKTIAVLGCGLNKIYPKENIPLYEDILNNNGLIISEYPPDTEAKSEYFGNRNRIISALSSGILVIEAHYRSGTSLTVKHAKQQKRPIFTIPHELWDPNGIGTNRLIKNGAILITDTSELLDHLGLREFEDNYNKLKLLGNFDKFSRKSLKNSVQILQKQSFERLLKKSLEKSIKENMKKSLEKSIKKNLKKSLEKSIKENMKKTLEKSIKKNLKKSMHKSTKKNMNNSLEKSTRKNINNSLVEPIKKSIERNITFTDSRQQIIYNNIKNTYTSTSVSANEIAQKTNIPINEVLSILFVLELAGFIKKVSGGYICI